MGNLVMSISSANEDWYQVYLNAGMLSMNILIFAMTGSHIAFKNEVCGREFHVSAIGILYRKVG